MSLEEQTFSFANVFLFSFFFFFFLRHFVVLLSSSSILWIHESFYSLVIDQILVQAMKFNV